MAELSFPTVYVAPIAIPTPAYRGPVTFIGLAQPARLRKNYAVQELGQGIGRVRGTVKEKHDPANTPVYRRVRLIVEKSGSVLREMWSDPVTGNYDFQYVDELETYTVLSYDHTHNFRATIADNLSLANGLVELMP